MGDLSAQSELFISDESSFTEVVENRGLSGEALQLYTHLNGRVIGQERACKRVARAFAIHYAGLSDPRMPLGAYVFAGPTGVGKTMAANEIARHVIADLDKAPLTKIQGGRYKERHQMAELVGSPHGYVKSDELGLLAQCRIDEPHFWVKAAPHIKGRYKPLNEKQAMRALVDLYPRLAPYLSVILFDEIEKANPAFWEMLLHILSDGELAMADGSTTSFVNSVVMLTCNVGATEQQDIIQGRKVGFQPTESSAEREDKDQLIYEATVKQIEKFFSPELVGRLRSHIIVFRTLSRDDCSKVLTLMLKAVQNMVSGNVGSRSIPVILQYSEPFRQYLLDEGISEVYGLRPLKETVRKEVLNPLANGITAGEIREADIVLFTMDPATQKPVMKRKARPDPVRVDPSAVKAPALLTEKAGGSGTRPK